MEDDTRNTCYDGFWLSNMPRESQTFCGLSYLQNTDSYSRAYGLESSAGQEALRKAFFDSMYYHLIRKG